MVGYVIPISASLDGSSETVSSLFKKLLMALNAYSIIEKKTSQPFYCSVIDHCIMSAGLNEVGHLVSDVLVRVHSKRAEGGQDAHGTLSYTVIVVCGSKAQHSCCT